MNRRESAAYVLVTMLALTPLALAQRSTEVRRAQPVEDPPILRAQPVGSATPAPRRAAPPAPSPPAETQTPVPRATATPPPPTLSEPPPESEPSSEPLSTGDVDDEASPARRQLDYANALFGRKLYDLAVPEYEKFLGQFPGAVGRASVYFYLGQCYRSLNRTAAARSSFQSVLDEYGESEFAGPATRKH